MKFQSFIYFDRDISELDRGALRADIPSGITEPQQLMNALFDTLQLPGYFGFNWDALSDCLRDFHWLNVPRILIIHHDLPLVLQKDRLNYLEVLERAVM